MRKRKPPIGAALALVFAFGLATAAGAEDYQFILTPGWDAATASYRNASTSRSSGSDIVTGALRAVSTSSDLEARYRTFDESDPTDLRSDEWLGIIFYIR